jgi:hypothetical protein
MKWCGMVDAQIAATVEKFQHLRNVTNSTCVVQLRLVIHVGVCVNDTVCAIARLGVEWHHVMWVIVLVAHPSTTYIHTHTTMALPGRSELLALFRNSLHLARHISSSTERHSMLGLIRNSFRSLQSERDAHTAAVLYSDAKARDQMLRMKTSKLYHRKPVTLSANTTYIYDRQTGKVVLDSNGSQLRTSRTTKDGRLDPADIARHHRLVRRQHFMKD